MTLLSESDPENGTAANDFDEYGALILRFFGVHELILYFSVSLAFVLIDVFDLGLHPKVLALIKTETKKRSESSAALVQLNPRHLVDECFLCRFGSNLLMWRLQYSGDDWMGSAPYLFDIPHEWKLESRPGKVIWAQSGTAERERERERKKESGPRTRKQILKVALELIAQFLRVEGGEATWQVREITLLNQVKEWEHGSARAPKGGGGGGGGGGLDRRWRCLSLVYFYWPGPFN